MPRVVGLCVFLGSLLFSAAAQAATLTLTGVIRDFLPSGTATGTYNGALGTGHEDFENHAIPFGHDLKVVKNTLGADGKPVFDPTSGSYNSTTTQANFDQWFNDTAGKNLSQAHSIVLNDSASPGVYTYNSSAFFPIDGQLYGNNVGWDHNYGFTFELSTTFGYQAGQTFSFMGDDDLFVFINGQRVINLGGVTPPWARRWTWTRSAWCRATITAWTSFSPNVTPCSRPSGSRRRSRSRSPRRYPTTLCPLPNP